MTIRRRRRLARVGLIMLLTALLALLLYGSIRDALAPWLARVYGTIMMYYRTIPQPVLWLVCIGLGIVIAARSLMVNEKWSPEEGTPLANRGRVQTLRLWIRQAPTEVYFDRHLAQRLGRLALEIQSHTGDQNDTPGPMRRRLDNLDLPPHVREYLKSGLDPMVADRHKPLGCSWLASLLRPPEVQPAPHIDLAEIVRLLEDQLEVRHDVD